MILIMNTIVRIKLEYISEVLKLLDRYEKVEIMYAVDYSDDTSIKSEYYVVYGIPSSQIEEIHKYKPLI